MGGGRRDHPWQTVSWGVVSDGLGNFYVTGTTNGSLDAANGGLKDGFVSKLNAAGVVQCPEQQDTSAVTRIWASPLTPVVVVHHGSGHPIYPSPGA